MVATLAGGTAAHAAEIYAFSGTTDYDNAAFSGRFTLSQTDGAYTLEAFSARYAGYTYDLGNTGLLQKGNAVTIGGTLNGVDTMLSKTNDFRISAFVPGSDGSAHFALTRPGLPLTSAFIGGTATITLLAPQVFDYSFEGVADGDASFAGSFTLREDGGVYSLAKFTASYAGYSYDLGNTGLQQDGNTVTIGGTLSGVGSMLSKTNDFRISAFVPGASSTRFAVTRPGLPIYNLFPGGTLSLSLASAVPEAGSWAMMVGGFAAVGCALRHRRRRRPGQRAPSGRARRGPGRYAQVATGGRLIRIASMLPPVLRPNSVPRS